MSERITKEQTDAAELIVNEAENNGAWVNMLSSVNEVLLDGVFTTEQLEAIILLKRYQLQQGS